MLVLTDMFPRLDGFYEGCTRCMYVAADGNACKVRMTQSHPLGRGDVGD